MKNMWKQEKDNGSTPILKRGQKIVLHRCFSMALKHINLLETPQLATKMAAESLPSMFSSWKAWMGAHTKHRTAEFYFAQGFWKMAAIFFENK